MYSGDMTWTDWTKAANLQGASVKSAIDQAKILYDKWYAFTYGLTPTQIAALPQMSGHTAADVTTLTNAIGVLNDFYSALHNIAALPQFDREGYLTPLL